MSKKSLSAKKKPHELWFNCEKCSTLIASNDCSSHEKFCPIEVDTQNFKNFRNLSFIKKNSLYTTSLEKQLITEELSELPKKHLNNLIFISEGAIRLCRFFIGQKILISCLDKPELPPIIRTIWPKPDSFLTTIFVAEDDYEQNFSNYRNHQLKLEELHSDPIPADEITLELLEPIIVDLTAAKSQLEKILSAQLKTLIFTKGNEIKINFLNKNLIFLIKNFESELMPMAESLETKLGNLKLSQQIDLIKVTHKTKIIIELKDPIKEKQVNKPTITKADIGGYSEILAAIEDNAQIALGFYKIPHEVKIPRGILIHGPSGCGKSMICEAICNEFHSQGTKIIKIKTCEIFSKFFGETEQNLSTKFEDAFKTYPKPSIIFIEDVNNICPKQETNDIIKRVSAAFLDLLDTLHSTETGSKIFILATSGNIENLNSGIRRCGRLDIELEISAPSPLDRLHILKKHLTKTDFNINDENIKKIADVTHAFVGSDLATLVYKAAMNALKHQKDKITIEDVDYALTQVKPSAMRQVLIECPNVRWSDVGGQDELKLKLKQAIEWPLIYPEKLKQLGIKPPRGVLMFGPPGCSKTLIAKALATESNLNFLSIKGPELFSMWVGESERAVREVFRKARQVAPSIIFFDEIDAIGGERSASGQSVKERVLTQLLTELDGVDTLRDVTVVAATNRPDMIDKALLRPGRIDRIIYVGLPDENTRKEIFKIKLNKMPLAEDVNVNELAQKTDGYSGAEIQAVCNEAALKTLEESFDAQHVEKKHFENALQLVRPRTSKELLNLYDEYLKKK